MLEVPDLFHENRLPELTLSLILYIPLGICLVLIRAVAILFLFLTSSVLSDEIKNEALRFILTFTYVDETAQNQSEDDRRSTKIIVSNRVSCFDFIALTRLFPFNRCKMVNLWKETSWMNWFKLQTVSCSGTQESLFDLCANQVQQSDYQLVFLPECEPTTGSDGLLKFNLLPFTLAKKLETSVLPVCLRTSRAFQIKTSIFNSDVFTDLFWFLFSPYTRFHINYLPTISPKDSVSDEVFCEKIRQDMSRTLNVELTQFDEPEVIELKKRPDLFHRRHEQRRLEFQQMVNLVHGQVPLASLEAIRYDLETTKNVQRTIANLNERATAAARAANKSTPSSSASARAMSKSSGGSNHRQIYERLKQELIEKNRQLFLQKNSV